jgi:hypothetical protein
MPRAAAAAVETASGVTNPVDVRDVVPTCSARRGGDHVRRHSCKPRRFWRRFVSVPWVASAQRPDTPTWSPVSLMRRW